MLFPHPADASADDAPDVDVHDTYAEGWLPAGGVRANFVCSADGAAQAKGTSAGLQTPGDNRVFAALRDLADVVLAGAGTVTIEGYRAVTLSERRKSVRREYGLRDVLPTAVVSRSLRFDPESSLFVDAPDEARTIVLTCEAAPADRRGALAAVADVMICGGALVEPLLARRALEERGLTRILSEGGPTSFADLLLGGVVDELCLSMSPLLVGPGPSRIVAGPADWNVAGRLRLTGLLEDDGALFVRYRVAGARADE
jgi:riboflavin biosynthesis pyrimidine reductase